MTTFVTVPSPLPPNRPSALPPFQSGPLGVSMVLWIILGIIPVRTPGNGFVDYSRDCNSNLMTRSPCVSQAPTPSSSSFTITDSAISFFFNQRCETKVQLEHRARKKCLVEVSTPGSSAISFKQREHVSTLHHCNHYHFCFLWLNVFYSHDLT